MKEKRVIQLKFSHLYKHRSFASDSSRRIDKGYYSFKLAFEIDVTFSIRDTRDNEVRNGRSNARTRLYDPI